MSRKPVWPPKVYFHRPSGRDRIRVDGNDYWLGPSGSEQARAEYARLVTLLAPAGGEATPRPKEKPPAIVSEVVAIWLAEEAKRLTEKELSNYQRALAVLVRVHGRTPAAAFDCAALREVRTAMTDASWLDEEERAYFARQGREPRWCARVANRQTGRIKTVWRWLEQARHVPRGSWGELRLLRGIDPTDRRVRRTPKVRPATLEDVEAVCAALRSRAVRAMVRLMWWTAMRPGECRRMRGSEVDRTGETWIYRPTKHKNDWRDQDRVIPLGPNARALLAPLLAASGRGLLFRNQHGDPYTSSGFATTVSRAGERCGRGWLVAYSIRHGAKQRVTREMGLDAARSFLGHASIGTTAQYAAGADLELATEVARRLG